uniref:Chemokine interleukin-8-like domain-containing protein n=1 Tax=Rhinolophus ferrumequinum TaxID=59479 RepID=A0A671E8F7_RHIFE
VELPVAALAALLLTMALCSQTCSASSESVLPYCFILHKFVDDTYETNSPCSKGQSSCATLGKETGRQRQVCADPREAWVQEYIPDLELNA